MRVNGIRLRIDQTEHRCRWRDRDGAGGRDGFVDAVVNAQCDLVFAGAQSTFKQQPVFAFRRQSAVRLLVQTTRNSEPVAGSTSAQTQSPSVGKVEQAAS